MTWDLLLLGHLETRATVHRRGANHPEESHTYPLDPMNEKAKRKPKNETQRESHSPIIIIIKLTKRPEITW